MTNAGLDSQYKTVEASFNRRQGSRYSYGLGASHTWSHAFPAGAPYSPNGPFDDDSTSYSVKANLTYTAPWDVMVSAVYRLQSGQNYARTLAVSAPASCACTFGAGTSSSSASNTVYVGRYDDYRQDNAQVFDLRLEKSLRFADRIRLRLFVDGFNLFNAYAAETINRATGPRFQTPTAVLGPRTGRVGFRLGF